MYAHSCLLKCMYAHFLSIGVYVCAFFVYQSVCMRISCLLECVYAHFLSIVPEWKKEETRIYENIYLLDVYFMTFYLIQIQRHLVILFKLHFMPKFLLLVHQIMSLLLEILESCFHIHCSLQKFHICFIIKKKDLYILKK